MISKTLIFTRGKELPEKNVMIYRHPNPDIISFLTDEDISAFRVELFKNPTDNLDKNTLKLLGNIGAQVVKDTMCISGVREIHIKPHELFVKKETAAAWENIEEKIVEILSRALRKKMIRVVQ